MTTSGCELDIAEGARSCRAHPASAATPKTMTLESSVRQPTGRFILGSARILPISTGPVGPGFAKKSDFSSAGPPNPVARLFRRGHLVVTEPMVGRRAQ